MTDRYVIHSMGRFRWQLAVCGSDVTASRHHPNADGSTFYTTADFGLTTRDPGRDNCSIVCVVSAYRSRSDCAVSSDDLIARVRAAINDGPSIDTTREAIA